MRDLIALTICAILVAYFASVGPAYRVWGGAALKSLVFAPLMSASRSRLIGQAVVWYLKLWPYPGGNVIYGGQGGILFFQIPNPRNSSSSDD